MDPRELTKLLFDVERACERIQKFILDRSVDDFLNDEMLQSAVERQSEIIGEALNQALGLNPGLSSRISGIRRIISLRNRLIHGYSSVSPPRSSGVS